MANQVQVVASFRFQADGVSTNILVNLTRIPFSAVFGTPNNLINPFGGTTALPKSVTATIASIPGVTTSLDALGNLLITLPSAPAAGVYEVDLTMLFA